MVVVLLISSSGVLRGLLGIWRHVKFCTSPLIAASKAGALCTVVRTAEWKHQDGIVIQGLRSLQKPALGELVPITYEVEPSSNFTPSHNKFDISSRKVHGNLGKCPLPLGYALAMLPPGTTVKGPGRDDPKDPSHSTRYGTKISFSPDSISPSYSLSHGLIAILQTISAFITLYLSRGNQLQHYGYAAFGLTVIPYLLISIVNLLSTILTPDYDKVYLIYSEIMREAVGQGGTFDGVVGCIVAAPLGEETFDATFAGDNDNTIMQPVTREQTGGSIQDEQTLETNTTLGTDAPLETKTPEDTNTPSITTQRVIVPSYPRNDSGLTRGLVASYLRNSSGLTRGLVDSYPGNDSGLTRGILEFYGSFYGSIFIGSIAIATIGGLTSFHRKESTRAQQAWTMTWLASWIFFGLVDSVVRTQIHRGPQSNPFLLKVFYIYGYVSPDSGRIDEARYTTRMLGFVYSLSAFTSLILVGIPSIGGFVVVGRMLRAYGNCTRLY